MPNTTGTYHIDNIPYKDDKGAWRSVGIGDNHLLNRDFNVASSTPPPNPDTSPPTISVTALGVMRDSLPITANANDQGTGVSWIRFYLACGSNYGDYFDDHDGSNGWGGAFNVSSLSHNTLCNSDAMAFDGANNSTTSDGVTGA